MEALSSIKNNYLQGVHRQVVSACTGFGKSVVLSHIPDTMAGKLDGQTLVLVHRDELIDQNIEKLRKYNPTIKVSKEKAESLADPDAEIIVASVQTLGRLGKRADRFNWDAITKVITDECHHATSQSYINVYEKADVLRVDTPKLHVGFTATPNRADGNTLAKIYDKIVFNYPIRQAIDEGWLVDVKGRRIDTGQSLDGLHTVSGDFNPDELSNAIDNPERNQLVVKSWLEYGNGERTIGFTAGILHAQNVAELFKNYGVTAEAIWGDDPLRSQKLEKFRKGDTTVLLNCAILTEGFDMWQVGCILIIAPTKSIVKYTQEIGRGTRLEEGCPNLLTIVEDCSMTSKKFKDDCLVLDFCDLSRHHSLASLPTLFGMPAKLNLRGRSAVWAATELENAQEEFSHLDFSTLSDIEKINVFIEETNLFEIKSNPEVEANSTLVWHSTIDGGYILMLPDKDSLNISQNLLDKFIIKAHIKGRNYKAERASIEEAFSAADGLVMNVAPETLKVVNRSAGWRGGPASKKQMRRIRKLFKNKQIPANLSSGSASNIIGAALAGKYKKDGNGI